MHAPMAAQHGGSPPFCVDTTATTAGRTTTQCSTDSIGNAPNMATVSETAQPESRRTGWSKFETLTARASPANSAHHSNLGASTDMARVTLGKSRVREICPPGSVRAKAEWLSYSTTILSPDSAVHWHSVQVSRATDASWGRDVATSVVKCALMRQQEKNADILRSEEPIRENRSVLAARLF